MPFYEYECSNCKFYTELLQKVSDPPLKKCPSCKKATMKKLVSAPVFRLKGGGWYETDFKSDKEGRRNLVEKEAAANDSSMESKPDAKPAADAKSESKPAESKPAESAEKPAAKRRSAAAPAKRTAARPTPKPNAPARKKRR